MIFMSSVITMADGKLTTTANPKLIGTDARTLKAGDDPFGQRIYDTMKSTAPGTIATVDYKFPKPGTTQEVRAKAILCHPRWRPGMRRRLYK